MCRGIAIIVLKKADGTIQIYGENGNSSHLNLIIKYVRNRDEQNPTIEVEYLYPNTIVLHEPDDDCKECAYASGLVEKTWLGMRLKSDIQKEILDYIDAVGLAHDKGTLQGAILEKANLRDTDLSRANLRDANLSYADLRGANLRDVDLRFASLRGADLRFASLGGAGLGGANLRGANLRDVDLRDANLRGADLRFASLGGANLSGANLRDANLYNTTF